jgi:Glycosyl hydrolases family 15
VSALALNGRVDEARALFERLLGLTNDLGLLAEEYDVKHQRQVGNFPQAFSHLTPSGRRRPSQRPRRPRMGQRLERGMYEGRLGSCVGASSLTPVPMVTSRD